MKDVTWYNFWYKLRLCDSWHGNILLLGLAFHICLPLCCYMWYKVLKYHAE